MQSSFLFHLNFKLFKNICNLTWYYTAFIKSVSCKFNWPFNKHGARKKSFKNIHSFTIYMGDHSFKYLIFQQKSYCQNKYHEIITDKVQGRSLNFLLWLWFSVCFLTIFQSRTSGQLPCKFFLVKNKKPSTSTHHSFRGSNLMCAMPVRILSWNLKVKENSTI